MPRRYPLPLILASSLAASCLGSVQGGTTTYRIQNYPASQDGWTLTGTITLNTTAASGTLTEGIIQSWSWTVSKGSESYTHSSTEEDAEIVLRGTINYTATQILMPAGTAMTRPTLSFATNSGENAILWSNVTGSEFFYDRYRAGNPSSRRYAWFTSPDSLGGTTWIIAVAVPEPSALLSAGTGFTCVILFAIARRRRVDLGSAP
jgi:hypothetical protein